MLSEPDEGTDLGDGYKYSEWDYRISGPLEMPDKVVAYENDSIFIVALQEWSFNSIYSDIYDFGIPLGNVNNYYRKNPTPDNLYYWVINKRDTTNTGPLIETRFIEVCDSMGVPQKMVDKMIKARKEIKSRK